MDNPYQAPVATLQEQALDQRAPFYVVSERKFLALFLGTFGLYQIYWFYRHWKAQNEIHQRYWPVARGIFAIFFVHELFRAVCGTQEQEGRTNGFDASFFATSFVVLAITTWVCNRMAYREIGSPLTDLVGFLLLPCTAWVLLKAQQAANLASNDRSGQSNAHFSGANIAWLVLGGCLWLVALLGTFVILTEG